MRNFKVLTLVLAILFTVGSPAGCNSKPSSNNSEPQNTNTSTSEPNISESISKYCYFENLDIIVSANANCIDNIIYVNNGNGSVWFTRKRKGEPTQKLKSPIIIVSKDSKRGFIITKITHIGTTGTVVIKEDYHIVTCIDGLIELTFGPEKPFKMKGGDRAEFNKKLVESSNSDSTLRHIIAIINNCVVVNDCPDDGPKRPDLGDPNSFGRSQGTDPSGVNPDGSSQGTGHSGRKPENFFLKLINLSVQNFLQHFTPHPDPRTAPPTPGPRLRTAPPAPHAFP